MGSFMSYLFEAKIKDIISALTFHFDMDVTHVINEHRQLMGSDYDVIHLDMQKAWFFKKIFAKSRIQMSVKKLMELCVACWSLYDIQWTPNLSMVLKPMHPEGFQKKFDTLMHHVMRAPVSFKMKTEMRIDTSIKVIRAHKHFLEIMEEHDDLPTSWRYPFQYSPYISLVNIVETSARQVVELTLSQIASRPAFLEDLCNAKLHFPPEANVCILDAAELRDVIYRSVIFPRLIPYVHNKIVEIGVHSFTTAILTYIPLKTTVLQKINLLLQGNAIRWSNGTFQIDQASYDGERTKAQAVSSFPGRTIVIQRFQKWLEDEMAFKLVKHLDPIYIEGHAQVRRISMELKRLLAKLPHQNDDDGEDDSESDDD